MKLKITVHGVAYEVDVEVLDAGEGFPSASQISKSISKPRSSGGSAAVATPPSDVTPTPTTSEGGVVTSPIAGTVHELKCRPGDTVGKGQELLVIEAMKMNTSITAPTGGKVKNIPVAVGDSVREGQTLVELE
jgi:biotin carboxyl carrier protein